MIVHNKLVRDNIPEIIENAGKKPNIRVLEDKEYIESLNKKLLEEVNEYLEDNDTNEIADVLEVLYSILDYNDISIEKINEIRELKNKNNGSFKKRIYLESVE